MKDGDRLIKHYNWSIQKNIKLFNTISYNPDWLYWVEYLKVGLN